MSHEVDNVTTHHANNDQEGGAHIGNGFPMTIHPYSSTSSNLTGTIELMDNYSSEVDSRGTKPSLVAVNGHYYYYTFNGKICY